MGVSWRISWFTQWTKRGGTHSIIQVTPQHLYTTSFSHSLSSRFSVDADKTRRILGTDVARIILCKYRLILAFVRRATAKSLAISSERDTSEEERKGSLRERERTRQMYNAKRSNTLRRKCFRTSTMASRECEYFTWARKTTTKPSSKIKSENIYTGSFFVNTKILSIFWTTRLNNKHYFQRDISI